MKPTGIIRRVDDLGRVVIPKEIRRTLRIHEGDPLELYVDNGGIMFKKYSEISAMEEHAKLCAKGLHAQVGATVLICDTDVVIYAEPASSRFLRQPISEDICELIRAGKEYLHQESDTAFPPFDKVGGTNFVQLMIPIREAETICGAVVVLHDNASATVSETLLCCCRMAAVFLSGHMEN